MTLDRKSIPTRYKDILFRSKLEADWAVCLDRLYIPWEYEKEGRYWGEVFYLPDFYLPQSHQYFEVKGVWTPDDLVKWEAVQRLGDPLPHGGDWIPDIKIVVGLSGGEFQAGFSANSDTALFQCDVCGGWWFLDASHTWGCRCCGVGDGDHHLRNALYSPIQPFPWYDNASYSFD